MKNFDITIGYNTNLSRLTYKNNNIFDYWKQFSNISVGASIDASDQVAEYMRHGLDFNLLWDRVNQFLNDIPERNSLTFIITMNNLSVTSLQNLFVAKNVKLH